MQLRPRTWLVIGVVTALVLIGSSAALLGSRILGNDDWGRDSVRGGGAVVLVPDRPTPAPERSADASRRAQQEATGGTVAPSARTRRRVASRAPQPDSDVVRVREDDVDPGPPSVVRTTPGDIDRDGLSDDLEERIGTDPEHEDTDGDALPDAWEEQHGLDPTSSADAASDVDGDGLLNRTEFRVRSNPRAFDTNHDGTPDGADDADGDGVVNVDEVVVGTDPAVPDTPEPPVVEPPAPADPEPEPEPEPPAPETEPAPPVEPDPAPPAAEPAPEPPPAAAVPVPAAPDTSSP